MPDFSFIIGRVVTAGSVDGLKPLPSSGRIRFTPIAPAGDDITDTSPIIAPIDRDGYIGHCSRRGVWLAPGRYEVAFELRHGSVPWFIFDLDVGYTPEAPLNLATVREVSKLEPLPGGGGGSALAAHIAARNPHPTYDSIEDLSLVFENRLV